MHLVHINAASIVLLLDNAFNIERAWRVRSTYHPPACVVQLDGITPRVSGSSEIKDGDYHADGLACWRLLGWVIEQRPHGRPKAHRAAFDRLFTENTDDVFKAIMRIHAGTWSAAPGEEGYYCREQIRNHPLEFEAVAVVGMLHQAGLLQSDTAISPLSPRAPTGPW